MSNCLNKLVYLLLFTDNMEIALCGKELMVGLDGFLLLGSLIIPNLMLFLSWGKMFSKNKYQHINLVICQLIYIKTPARKLAPGAILIQLLSGIYCHNCPAKLNSVLSKQSEARFMTSCG
jgi:hypothetical protein